MLFFQDEINIHKTIMKEMRNSGQCSQITILWVLSQLEKKKKTIINDHNIKLDQIISK